MACFIVLFAILINSMQDEYIPIRKRMVESQIVSRGVSDPATIRAMLTVPRHLFIPTEYWYQAYEDHPVFIGYGQTISQPYIVAYMTEVLGLDEKDTVLEIGTGSGYQAAVLAEIVSMVYTIEIVKPLGTEASNRLKVLGYKNVKVFIGDGYYGLRNYAPYDAIIVTAAPETIPPALLEQLKEGGRLIIPVGAQDNIQYLELVEKKKGKITSKILAPVRFVPLTRSGKP